MARTRNLKPSFFTNEMLADLPPLARLFFQGLWLQADKEGRLEDRPRKLRAEILPYDDCDVEHFLMLLADSGFILRYTVEGNRYIALPTFRKHQNPHPKESDSVIPAPPQDNPSASSRGKKRQSRVRVDEAPGSWPENPESEMPSPNIPHAIPSLSDTSIPSRRKPHVAFSDGDVFAVFDNWRQVLEHPQARYDEKRKRLIRARLADGFSVEELKLAAVGCRRSPHHQGQTNGTIYDSIELIYRSVANVERFIGYAQGTGLVPVEPKRFLTDAEKLDATDAYYRSLGEPTAGNGAH